VDCGQSSVRVLRVATILTNLSRIPNMLPILIQSR
jgi:hypothetical protein